MAQASSDPSNKPPPAKDAADYTYSSDDPQSQLHPRIIEEHHEVGPRGEDEVVATDELGRRWYHLRPQPRQRYDMIGFNWTWWILSWVFLMLVILPIGGAYRY